MARARSHGQPEGLTRRDFAHATVKAGVAAGAAIWVAPQVSSYALAQSVGSSPPSPAGAHRGDETDDSGPRDPDPARPSGGSDKSSDRRRDPTSPPSAADAVVSDPRFTG